MNRTVVVAGATGLVGRALVLALLRESDVQTVYTVGRRRPDVEDPKLIALTVDVAALPELPRHDEVYLALGTTIKVAGSQAAFRAVDFDANLAVAHAAMVSGARRCGLVSAMGADAKSRIFYNRVKGELEETLTELPFDALVIARPSLLTGDRAALGQPGRPLEKFFNAANTALGPLIPSNYRPIAAADVARALITQLPRAEGRLVMLSGEMQHQ